MAGRTSKRNGFFNARFPESRDGLLVVILGRQQESEK